ncbi:STAS domain-containing protein [Streptomyces sp. NPDC059002]|uniref:STAS domain-containing protein n=1 Tax=Streptomyces sp. NPDC059002 TaxID=3346690 RepID=UPI0036956353
MAGEYNTTDAQERLTIQDASTASDRHVLLRLAGDLDYATVPALCDAVVDILADGKRHITLDLSAITWCDNASLYTLLGIRSALQHADGRLTLIAASPAIRRALDRTGLYPRLPLTGGGGYLPPRPGRRPSGDA